jgi:anti-repressor protein
LHCKYSNKSLIIKWIEEQKEKKALEIKVGELSIENKELEKRIEEDTPKVIFAMAVTESKRSCLVAELAKIICQNGMEIGQNRLFKWVTIYQFTPQNIRNYFYI